MGSLLRVIAGIVGLAIVLVIGAVLYLTMVLDPNDYRDDIERLAAKQGVPLEINGDLSWQWFPTLGLSVEGVKVMTGDEALLDAERLAAAVAVMPLFSGNVSIEALEFSGVQVNVWKDKQGRGNWELLQQAEAAGAADKKAKETASTPATDSTAAKGDAAASPVALVIERLRLENAQLVYRDLAAGSRIELSDLNLSVDGFDLAGQPFDLKQSAVLKLDGQQPLEISSEGQLGFNLEKQHLTMSGLQLEVAANKTPMTLELSGDVALETLAAQLDLALQPVNLAKWLTQFGIELPEMSAADALSKVSLSSKIVGDDGAWKLNNLSLKLDDTTFAGHAGMSKNGALELVLNGDKLDLDRYLPVPQEEVAEAKQQQAASAGSKGTATSPGANPLIMSDEPLDLSALKDIDATAAITLAQMTAKQLDFTDLAFKLKAKGGLVNLQTVSATLDKGKFNLNGSLDARQKASKVALKGDLTNLELKPLLVLFMDEERLSGSAGGDLTLNTQGQSLRQWQQAAKANLNLKAAELTFSGVDIERNACQLAALVNGKPSPELQWKGLTTLQDVSSTLVLNGEVLTIQSLSAGVENLGVKANGTLNYVTGKFDVPVSVAFVGEADPNRDCQIRDRWRNKDLPLRCKGSLDTVSAGSCGIDSKRINALLADEAKGELKDKLQEKLQEKLNKSSDDGETDSREEAVKSLLKGLFNKE
ncbi:AsmA family protein [Aestuariicella sp. G3-2]|uniref:AsmA family protein n=1 Tax=Pseudomaricurvus albidus TaxID=2842452 RepID=UPI001C0E6560|nr:AsmA family protein [Aestuariicella albida]MBU3068774.1 AsmA family protein [Aestuariicella albida]